jgi:large subunit GTPase 1
VQIVDARNPLLFRTEDLERYVLEVDPEKRNLLLVNKADLMTVEQRRIWADWFEGQGIRFAFYSARLAKEAQEQEQEESEEEGDDVAEDIAANVKDISLDDTEEGDLVDAPPDEESDSEPPQSNEPVDPRTQILTVHELESLFLRESPPPKAHDPAHPTKIVVGLVGYPNVGKSSTINSLLGEKRVSVSSTPGKTKHFQTIHLPTSASLEGNAEMTGVILCDCPGLVFPNFASTKAELVCNGVLPIDQLREWTAPAELLAGRVPKEVLEQLYSFKIYSKSDHEEETGGVTGEELLISFACISLFRSSNDSGERIYESGSSGKSG